MFRYAVRLTPDPEGGFAVTLPAFPEVTRPGETREEALAEAVDLLDEANRLSRLDAYLRILGVKPRIEFDAAA